ncbi:DUF2971 domain-containing protein [Aeromonas veronii]|uniref:DUF2971 domain-containing protein n=1 Tax=Aeromonas veronii TaxID=654 RepID=UPI0030054D19
MKLYKFQTVNDHSIKALTYFRLYFSTPVKLNDPTEGMFRLLDNISSDFYIPDISELQNTGILSMASGEHSSIEESPFMWAHYGNALKGFCLVFDSDKFIDGIENDVEVFGCVNYPTSRPLLSSDNLISESWGLENLPGVDFKFQNLQRIYDVCFFNKPSSFKNEQEFRFIAKSSGEKPYNPDSLVMVIIGEKIDSNDHVKLLQVLWALGIEHKIRYAKTNRNSFKVHVS